MAHHPTAGDREGCAAIGLSVRFPALSYALVRQGAERGGARADQFGDFSIGSMMQNSVPVPISLETSMLPP